MAQEIELKVAVAGHSGVLDALRAAGAEAAGAFVETDRFFDTPDAAMRRGDSALRIRSFEPLEGAGPPPRPQVTFKGPRVPHPDGLKVRPEYQSHVDDAEALVEIFQACGLRAMLTIQKRRRSYRLGGCMVELDELPAIGCFVEIEGPDAEAVGAVRQRLGLAGEPITRSYVALIDAHFGRLPEGAEVTFETAG